MKNEDVVVERERERERERAKKKKKKKKTGEGREKNYHCFHGNRTKQHPATERN